VGRLRAALDQRPNDGWMILRQDSASLPVDEGLLISMAEQNPVTVAGRRVQDTCKVVIDGRVRHTVPRDGLVELRGPWIFTREAMKSAVDSGSQSFLKVETFADLCRVGKLRIRVVVID
jgi:2-C-methyl-D-erythritol 4-phosphate cytidylyltransferase